LCPLGAIVIGEVLAETDLPEGAFSILPCSRYGADLFTNHERFKWFSFTGSPDVVCALKSLKKPVILELGGYEACVVENVANDVKINAADPFGSESIMASFNDCDAALKEVNNR
jgi:acyl-CoA reductase-like NAD-dependent aldehyde dehydrogenase